MCKNFAACLWWWIGEKREIFTDVCKTSRLVMKEIDFTSPLTSLDWCADVICYTHKVLSQWMINFHVTIISWAKPLMKLVLYILSKTENHLWCFPLWIWWLFTGKIPTFSFSHILFIHHSPTVPKHFMSVKQTQKAGDRLKLKNSFGLLYFLVLSEYT